LSNWTHGGGADRELAASSFSTHYALQVDWATLELLARTHILDVWYLFPLRDVTRQLARDFSGIGPKKPMLDRVLPPNWEALYSVRQPQMSLLDHMEPERRVRDASMKGIEKWFREELNRIFPYVSEPLPLLSEPGRQIFSLFLAVSNPSRPATDLARHFVTYAMK
jgi:three-Cys-motif partner protein